jgi:hypothetical protein
MLSVSNQLMKGDPEENVVELLGVVQFIKEAVTHVDVLLQDAKQETLV